MELAPPLLPPGRDLRHDGGTEHTSHPRRSGLVGVRRELEPICSVALLESGREEVDEDGPGRFRLGRRHFHRDAPKAAQRKTLFSLSKKPSFSR
jgi:hypothetical protein